jgi:hypothetical protein
VGDRTSPTVLVKSESATVAATHRLPGLEKSHTDLNLVLWAELKSFATPIVPPGNCHGRWQKSERGLAEHGKTSGTFRAVATCWHCRWLPTRYSSLKALQMCNKLDISIPSYYILPSSIISVINYCINEAARKATLLQLLLVATQPGRKTPSPSTSSSSGTQLGPALHRLGCRRCMHSHCMSMLSLPTRSRRDLLLQTVLVSLVTTFKHCQ